MHVKEQAAACYEAVKEKIPFQPLIGLVLGSGLGNFAERGLMEGEIAYSDIPDFPVSGVAGHKGRFIFTHIHGVPVVMMQGRVHYYEGYPIEKVVLPIRLMALMGVQALFLTNAAGSLNLSNRPGALMLITDHISSLVPSPLIGENVEEWGVRFPDMSCVYDRQLGDLIRRIGVRQNAPLCEGVYIQVTGPQYETPAEIKMYRSWGADAVGMSTVCEAIAAHHMGLRVCGVSCLTNFGTGMTAKPLSHVEVQEVGKQVTERFSDLMEAAVWEAGKLLQE